MDTKQDVCHLSTPFGSCRTQPGPGPGQGVSVRGQSYFCPDKHDYRSEPSLGAGVWHPVEEQAVDGFHSDRALRLRQGMDNPILQMRKLRYAEAESPGTEGAWSHSLFCPQGAGSPGPHHRTSHLAGPDTPAGLESPIQWGPDLGRLLHDSVPMCSPSKTPDTPFSLFTAPSTPSHPHGPLRDQLALHRPTALYVSETQDPKH